MSDPTSRAADVSPIVEPAVFRHVLGHLPTGVTVITGWTAAGPSGMAANSLSSVSLHPPLVLFCPGKSSETWPELRDARRFCVNVLAHHHESLSRQFAAKGSDRFAGIGYRHAPAGPALDGAVAWLECVLEQEHDAGDHTIAVAKVTALEARSDAQPLVFFRGEYGSFAAAEDCAT